MAMVEELTKLLHAAADEHDRKAEALRTAAERLEGHGDSIEVRSQILDLLGATEAAAAPQPAQIQRTPTGRASRGGTMVVVLEACNGVWHTVESLAKVVDLDKTNAAATMSRLKVQGLLDSRKDGVRPTEYTTSDAGRERAGIRSTDEEADEALGD